MYINDFIKTTFYAHTRFYGTFGEAAGTAVHLQSVEGADLQLGVVMQELLHDGFEGQQQLLLLLQQLFGGSCQLIVTLRHAQLLGDVLQETVKITDTEFKPDVFL